MPAEKITSGKGRLTRKGRAAVSPKTTPSKKAKSADVLGQYRSAKISQTASRMLSGATSKRVHRDRRKGEYEGSLHPIESFRAASYEAEVIVEGAIFEGVRSRKTDVVRARIETPIKQEAEAVLSAIGLTLSDALRLMLHRVVEERKLPFDPLIPNENTVAAILASRRHEVTNVGSPKNLMAALDAD